jgi:hypothetical protein
MSAALNALLNTCVIFARWCIENHIDPHDAASLVALARRAFHAGERNCNINEPGINEKYQKAMSAFEELAATFKFQVEWPGLWSTLKKDGRNINLPCTGD